MIHTKMSATVEPLGEVLQQAGLVSAAQIDVALRDQLQYRDLNLGEILSLRGWLKQKTADFFVEQWALFLNTSTRYPIGFYWQQAALLTEDQVNTIVQEQQDQPIRFGVLAVMKGWLKPATRDFFLERLFSMSSQSPFAERCLAPTLILDFGFKENG
ncbi:MAG: hypothetical protein ACFB4I_07710 [Cyanophyceae cyanobacterium]